MTNEQLRHPTQPHQYQALRSIQAPPPMDPNHELWLNEHPTGADLIGTYPALNQSNSAPRARYMSNMGPRPDDLPQPIPVHIEYPRDQSHHGSQPTTGVTQMTPGPSWNGYNALVAPLLDHCPPSRAPRPDYPAGPSEGNFGSVHSGMSVAEDLKRLASQYLSSPGSQVDKLRMRRSRSGGLKVLILLEVEDLDTM